MQNGLLRSINYPLPKLILGTKNWGDLVDLPEARSQLRTYLAAGGSAIEISAVGKNLAIAGELLAELTNRDQFQVHFNLSKVNNSARAQSEINLALSQTNLDYFDVLWANFEVQNLNIDNIVQFVEQNLKAEKTRYFGLDQNEFWEFIYLHENFKSARLTLSGLKSNWSLLERGLSNSELKACDFLNISVVAKKALGLGLLTGKYRFNTPSDSLLARGSTDLDNLLTSVNASKVEALATAADGIGVSPTEVAIAWLLAKPQVAATVVNVRNTSQLTQILEAIKLEIPEEIETALDEVGNFE